MANTENSQEMKKPVEIWQLCVAIIAVIISLLSMGSMYAANIEQKTAQQATVTENIRVRVASLEEDKIESREDRKEMKRDIKELLIMVKDKADRK